MSEPYVRCEFCDTFILLSACPKGVCSVCRYSHKKRKIKGVGEGMSCDSLHPNITVFCEKRKGHKGMHRVVLTWGNLKEYEEEHKELGKE